MALRGEEGRVKLRKAVGSCTRAVIHRCPNGATQLVEDQLSRFIGKRTRRTETSKYPEEEKTIVIALVAASERAIAQTNKFTDLLGL